MYDIHFHDAIAELPDILMGFKNGRQVFERPKAKLMRPAFT